MIKIDQAPNNHAAPIAFQPNGSLLAVAVSHRQVCLFDRETGRVIANLTHLEPAHPIWLFFSPDGTRLSVTRAGFAVALIAPLTLDDNPESESLAILGIAQVRLGQFQPGLSTLQRAAPQPETRPFVLYFIALAHHGLGQPELTADAFAQANAAHDELLKSLSPDQRDELALAHTEVEGKLRD